MAKFDKNCAGANFEIEKKAIKIGLDLDGVLVDKPPLVTKRLLEWLVKSHKNKGLAYRYPASRFERWIRWLSHHPLLRPPIQKNLEVTKKLAQDKRYRLYIVSGRYSFLESRTYQWLKFHRIDKLFSGVFINLKNDQPYLFKEQIIRRLELDTFVEDDPLIVRYLSKRLPETKILADSAIIELTRLLSS